MDDRGESPIRQSVLTSEQLHVSNENEFLHVRWSAARRNRCVVVCCDNLLLHLASYFDPLLFVLAADADEILYNVL